MPNVYHLLLQNYKKNIGILFYSIKLGKFTKSYDLYMFGTVLKIPRTNQT